MRLHAHYIYLVGQITELEIALEQELSRDEVGQRLQTIPGIGPITASVLSSQLGGGKQYSCSRDFAASTGLVPRQYSTGGKNTLLGISKRGDKNLRRLLVQCARSFIQRIENQSGRLADWVRALLARKTLQRSMLRTGQQISPDSVGNHNTADCVRKGNDGASLAGRLIMN